MRVAEIAQRAKMSSGQVMYYFTSKENRQVSQFLGQLLAAAAVPAS